MKEIKVILNRRNPFISFTSKGIQKMIKRKVVSRYFVFIFSGFILRYPISNNIKIL
jgi:hypothetical protein